MKNYLKYNLLSHLHIEAKKYTILWILPIVLLFFLLYYAYRQEVYAVYETNAETLCESDCNLSFYYPVEKGFYYDYIKINEKQYEIEEVYFGSYLLDTTNVGLQKITLKVKEYQGKNNEYVNLKIFKNKEKLIKKIIKIMKER